MDPDRVERIFEIFTPRARAAVEFAEAEARNRGDVLVTPEHILIGLLREKEGLGARVLESVDVTLERARAAIPRSGPPSPDAGPVRASLSVDVVQLVERASQNALAMGDEYVGTEHVLLSLLDEGESGATEALLELDVSPDEARELTWRALSPVVDDARGGDLDVEEGLMDGARPCLVGLVYDIRAELGRSPDSGDMLVALACVPDGVAREALAELGLDIKKLAAAAEAARRSGARSKLLPGTDVVAAMNELRVRQHSAIREQDSSTAAELRRRERELRERARERAVEADEDLRETVARYLGLMA